MHELDPERHTPPQTDQSNLSFIDTLLKIAENTAGPQKRRILEDGIGGCVLLLAVIPTLGYVLYLYLSEKIQRKKNNINS